MVRVKLCLEVGYIGTRFAGLQPLRPATRFELADIPADSLAWYPQPPGTYDLDLGTSHALPACGDDDGDGDGRKRPNGDGAAVTDLSVLEVVDFAARPVSRHSCPVLPLRCSLLLCCGSTADFDLHKDEARQGDS
jgi:hypothetical protein